jgi:SMODS and SLOG-associating 2TM effector domain 1/SMODS and SLOG-associating 2TM effector domain 3
VTPGPEDAVPGLLPSGPLRDPAHDDPAHRDPAPRDRRDRGSAAPELTGLDQTGLQHAADRTAAQLWWQHAWTGFVRSAIGVVGVLLAVWTSEIRSRECTPLVGCVDVTHSSGADETARICILLLFVLGALLELFCLLSTPDERWQAGSRLAATLSSCTWSWAMAAEAESESGQSPPQDYAAQYVVAAIECVRKSGVSLLPGPTPRPPDPTPGLHLMRQLPARERWSAYLEARLKVKELEFNLASHRAHRTASRLRLLLVLLYIVGIFFAALSMFQRTLDIGFLGVVSTFLTGRASALAARRPDAARRAYADAAGGLAVVRLRSIHADDVDRLGAETLVRGRVVEAEKIIVGVPPRTGFFAFRSPAGTLRGSVRHMGPSTGPLCR